MGHICRNWVLLVPPTNFKASGISGLLQRGSLNASIAWLRKGEGSPSGTAWAWALAD